MKNNGKSLLIYLLVCVAVITGLVYMLSNLTSKSDEKQYSEVMSQFDNLNVSYFELDLGSGELVYKLKDDKEDKEYKYTVPNVSLFANEVLGGEDAVNYRKLYDAENPDEPLEYNLIPISDNSFWLNLIPTLLMLGVMIFFFVFMMKSAAGGKMSSFGKTNARLAPSNKKATFADVAGADEEKEELKEIVDFLRDNKKYTEIGARIPKGVLLLGPPGTGKTLLARAVAGEANVPFYSISGSDFVEMFVGVGASRVRDLFEQAKKNAPSIIFIDEIDAVGRHRGAGMGGGHDEREQTLNQLLVEMDGFADNDSVIVIAATNRKDILDPALMRPGRFDRQIFVNYPDVKGREEILKVHTRNKPLAPDVVLSTIAKSTAGFTGAELENLVNEAALLAARHQRKAITMPDIEEATIKVLAGPEKKSHVVTEDEKRLVAYHEAGHAVVTYHMPTQDKVHQVTIIPRGSAGGMTIHLPEKEPSLLNVTERKLKEEIVVCMGGRVAEQLIIGEASAGAISDLQRSTKLAKAIVTQYGFSSKLGPVVYDDDNSEPFVGMDYGHSKGRSEKVQSEIDAEVREIIDECYDKTVVVLKENIEELHKVAKYLLVHEKIDGDDFEKLMKGEIDVEVSEDTSDEVKAQEEIEIPDTPIIDDTDL
ncbi:MAG: ATP-dependent zinc metalloprotease FtsH [Ruminococcus sp.]|nr:ATP-dependent zinc metalloprotease FtsH [Ruminococcus sp.]